MTDHFLARKKNGQTYYLCSFAHNRAEDFFVAKWTPITKKAIRVSEHWAKVISHLAGERLKNKT